MSNQTYTFKLTGELEGKTVNLGPNREYSFTDGVMKIECSQEDAKCHKEVLSRYYSAKLVKNSDAEADAEASAGAKGGKSGKGK